MGRLYIIIIFFISLSIFRAWCVIPRPRNGPKNFCFAEIEQLTGCADAQGETEKFRLWWTLQIWPISKYLIISILEQWHS